MKLSKPFFTAAIAACASMPSWSESALADTGERTPLSLGGAPTTHAASSGSSAGSGSLVHTFVGLAIVIAVIYGLYWVLKQVKASRQDKASGSGLEPIATLPLGTGRSLQMVRAGSDIVLIGVTENGVTPIKTYHEDEAERIGLLTGVDEYDSSIPTRPTGSFGGIVEGLRRRTVRR